MILVSLNGMLDFSERENETPELLEISEPMEAPSNPGHTVFAQYITSDNCGYCYQYGSPAHHQAKQSLPDHYVYISYHSASYGNTADAESGNIAPIYGVQHLGESGGAPKTSFGDDTLNTGCGSNTCWDSFISSGGNMHSTAADYSVSVGQSDNGDGTSDVTISASYIGSGTAVSSLTLYAAVTEKVCNSHVYNDGSKGHNCWEAWLLNNGAYASNSGNVGGGTGFETISLSSGSSSTTWTVPNNLVNGGATNMNVVAALYGGWSTSSFQEDVYAAADGTMQPPIDVAVHSLTVENQDGAPGFMTGDMLDLEVTVRNTGADTYSDGGTISLYHSQGGQDTLIDSTYLNTLSNAAGSTNTQTFSASFSTSSITNTPNGQSTFKAELSGLTGDGNGGNNVGLNYMPHDFVPSTDTPVADGTTSIPRGGSLDFDVSGNPQDSVDTMLTMTPEFEVSPSGGGAWSSAWVIAPSSITAPGTEYERYVFTVSPVSTAGSGDYDVRARFTDARGQVSDWKTANDAFTLMNGLPIVVDPSQPENTPASCSAFPGIPTVKVQTNESVPLAGLVCDAETPLSNLVITSNDPSFLGWNPSSQTIDVNFPSMQWDSMGNPLPQGIGISINDGEDTNTGLLMFNVIENGQPRWSSVSAVSFDEGGSTSVNLAGYLSDTTDNGAPASVMDLVISVESVEPAGIVTAEVWSKSLSLTAVDDDTYGSVVITLRATDSDGQFGETEMHVHVQNINDAPRFDNTGFDNLIVQSGQSLEIDLASQMNDVDDDNAEIWITTSAQPAGAAQYNPISGMLTLSWDQPGEQLVTISASDTHGADGTWQFAVTIVDRLPLSFCTDENCTNGDLDVTIINLHYGMNASVFVQQVSDLQLSDIIINWQICNKQTGICHTDGNEMPTGAELMTGHSFAASHTNGNGFENFDELKIFVRAIDSNGFDRQSEQIHYDATPDPASIDDDTSTDGNEDNSESGDSDDSSSSASGGMSSVALFGIIGLVALVILAGVLSMMLLRGGRRSEPTVDWGTEAAFGAPGAAVAPTMMAPQAAVAPQTVPDYTHLPVGGQYVTGHAGETVYLAPNGTAWTMQADNSFIRTS